MSHGGFFGGHHGHHGTHGHHLGLGLGGQVINASYLGCLLQGVFVSLFPSSNLPSWACSKKPAGNEHVDEKEQINEWESSLAPETFRHKLLNMDLRPLLLAGIALGGLFFWSSLIYWLRHNDDPTGKTYDTFKMRDAVVIGASSAARRESREASQPVSQPASQSGAYLPVALPPGFAPISTDATTTGPAAFGAPGSSAVPPVHPSKPATPVTYSNTLVPGGAGISHRQRILVSR